MISIEVNMQKVNNGFRFSDYSLVFNDLSISALLACYLYFCLKR